MNILLLLPRRRLVSFAPLLTLLHLVGCLFRPGALNAQCLTYQAPGLYSFTVPAGGPFTIRITTKGGDGGSTKGGSGASAIGSFVVRSGDQLTTIVGEVGHTYVNAGGGGGGTAVILSRGGSLSLLVAAGGGGGANPIFDILGGGGQGTGYSGGGAGGIGSDFSGGGGGGGGGGGLDAAGTGGTAGTRNPIGGGGGQASLTTISPGGASLQGSQDGGSGFGGGGGSSIASSGGVGGGGGYGGGRGGDAARGANTTSQGGYSYLSPTASAPTITPGANASGQQQNGFVNIEYPNNTATATITSRNTAVCAGQSTTITGTINATGTWTIILSDGTTKTGTGSTFSIPVTPSSSTTYTIQCLFDANGVALTRNVSGRAIVTLNPSSPPVITQQPVSGSSVVTGMTVVASARFSGQVNSFQWYKDGTPVAGQTSPDLRLDNVTFSQAGSYSLVATGDCNSVTTSAFSLSVATPASISGTKTVAGSFTPGGAITYTIVLTNSGQFTQADNLDDELTDPLPSSLTLTSASASSGRVQTSGGILTWNGSLTGGGSVTITIGATLNANTSAGQTILNQATIRYDADGNGTNDRQTRTDDPAVGGIQDATSFTVACPPLSVSLSNNGPLSCVQTRVTLTASGGGAVGDQYRFSGGASQVGSSNQATVGGAGVHSVTLITASGCTATASTTVTGDQTVPTVGISPSSTALSCDRPSVSLTAVGTGTVRWSTGETTPVISVSVAGPYSVTLTSSNGCSAVASVRVDQDNAAPLASLVSSGTLSCALTSVILTASPTGLTYVFGRGATQLGSSNQAVVSTGGLYSVTVLSANGCSAVASTSVSQDNSVPNASLVSSGSLTCSVTSVTLTASPNGQRYVFSSGATQVGSSNQALVNASGTYSVSVVSGNGCSSVASVSVAQDNTAPVATLVSSGSLTCAVTSVTLTANPNGQIYRFSSGANQIGTSNQAVVNTSGTYSVTVLSANGCSSVASTSVSQDNSAPFASLVSSGTLSCAVTSVTLTANPNGLRYVFSSGATQLGSFHQAVVNASGTYSVTVVNANGCSSMASVRVSSSTALPTLSISPASATLSCTSPTVSLTAVGEGSVRWSTQALTRVISVSTAGTYSVTLTSENGCSATTSVNVSQDNTAPVASLVSSGTLSCAVTSVTLTANPDALSYTFSNGAIQIGSSSQAVVNASGPYSVTVISANGCSSVASVRVSQDNAAPQASLVSSGSLSCSMTSVTLTASPIGQAYTFSGPGLLTQSGNSAVVNASGTYSVSVVSGNGCSSVASVSVSQDNTAPVATLVSSGGLTCSVTSVTITASPIGQRYTFSGPGIVSRSGNTAVVNAAGTYSVSVISGNGCSAVASVSVDQDQTAPVAGLVSSGSLTCSVTSVTLTASPNGQTYVFSGGATQIGRTNQATVSASGTYSVTVISGNGCSSVASVVVVSDQSLPTVSISPSSATLSCASPSVSLTAIGTGSVRWSTGETTPVISVNTAATYSVTLTSTNGCSAVASVSVNQDQTAPVASLVSSGSLTCSVSSVTLTASPNGQTYVFSAGATQIGTSKQAVVSTSGIYSVTVTSTNGCSSVASTSVSQDNTAPSVSIGTTPSLTITQGQSATLTATSNAAVTRYGWSTGESTPAIVVNTAGPYSATVVSPNGCSATASTVVSVTSAPVVSGPFAITVVTTLSCTTVLPNRYTISFTPQYSGLSGQPLSFSVANELLPTTERGPYTLQLYTDNPVLTLRATQAGSPPQTARFSYNWLAACQASSSANTPPRVVIPIAPQSAMVGVGFSYVIPAGTFTDEQTPGSLVLSASGLPPGLSLSGYTLIGVPSSTVGSPYSVSITATDPGGLSVSTSLVLTVSPAPGSPPTPSGVFSITGVSMLYCTPVADRINVSFVPQYGGLNGQAIAFSVINELAFTNEPGPYSLSLYRDNPTIVLQATQTGSVGEARFSYNWLAACASQGSDNTPPRVVNPVGPQSGTVGVSYSLNLSNVFADQETPTGLVLTAGGLPAGLSLVGTALSGTPSLSGVSSVTLTARDGGGLSASTSFVLTVSLAPSQPVSPPSSGFAITGVSTLSCVVVSGGQRQVTFTPEYSGLMGQPITFRVVNELAATSSGGPYTLKLYTDNPVISLRASQEGNGAEVSYAYNWLSACGAGSRLGGEPGESLQVVVLGNPVVGETVEVEVRGAVGSWLRLETLSERGYSLDRQGVWQAGSSERFQLRLGSSAGVYLLQVSTARQSQTVKVLKR